MTDRRRLLAVLALSTLVGCDCRSSTESDGGPAPSASASVAAAPAVVSSAPSASAPSASSHGADVTSGASAPWTPGPPVVVDGSVDGDALRARAKARLSSLKHPVVMLQGDDPRDLGFRLCQRVVPRVPTTKRILIKPNFGGFSSIRAPQPGRGDNGVRGRTTDPRFVHGVVDCLVARGLSRITIVESWGGNQKAWERLTEVSGYADVARATGVKLVGMADDGHFDTIAGQPGKPLRVTAMGRTLIPTILMPKILAEHLQDGLVILAPKLKAHRYSVVSIGIKNLMGNVMLSDRSPAYRQKWRMHKELPPILKQLKEDRAAAQKPYHDALDAFARRMVDLLAIEAPHVTLVEGAPAMGGSGFEALYPTTESVAIGGRNVIAVDVVGSRFLGLWDSAKLRSLTGGRHAGSPLITRALKRYGLDARKIRIEGDGAKLLDAPRPTDFDSLGKYSIHSPLKGRTKPTLTAPRASTAPRIDGKGDDAAWKLATPIDIATDYRGRLAGPPTRLRLTWDAAGLYALFEMDSWETTGPPGEPVDQEHATLYRHDCVELFLDPDPATPKRYLELEFGPYGHKLDLSVDREKHKHDTGWDGNVTVATTQDVPQHRAVVEVAIRAPEIVTALKAGTRLPLGVFRVEAVGKKTRYLAWSPPRTPRPQFHVPEAFGSLVLAP